MLSIPYITNDNTGNAHHFNVTLLMDWKAQERKLNAFRQII
jgi:hypothetical protein